MANNNVRTHTDPEFVTRIRRIANALSYGADVSQYASYDIVAAKMYLRDQEKSCESESQTR